MNSSQSEKELCQLIKESDYSAFRELYNRLYKPLYFFVFSRLKDEDLSKDILQEVFLKFWNNRESLDPDKSVKSLLYTMTGNSIIDHTRKSYTSNLSLVDLNENEEVEDQQEEETGNEDLIEKINLIVDKQPDSVKAVYILSKVEGYKNSEIAGILDISVKTVEARMTKLLKELREKLSLEKNRVSKP